MAQNRHQGKVKGSSKVPFGGMSGAPVRGCGGGPIGWSWTYEGGRPSNMPPADLRHGHHRRTGSRPGARGRRQARHRATPRPPRHRRAPFPADPQRRLPGGRLVAQQQECTLAGGEGGRLGGGHGVGYGTVVPVGAHGNRPRRPPRPAGGNPAWSSRTRTTPRRSTPSPATLMLAVGSVHAPRSPPRSTGPSRSHRPRTPRRRPMRTAATIRGGRTFTAPARRPGQLAALNPPAR